MNMSGSSTDESYPTSSSDESIAAWALMELEERASHVHHMNAGGRDVEERGSVVASSRNHGGSVVSNDCPAVFGANYYVAWEHKLGSDEKFVGWCTGIDYDARVITLTWTNQSVSQITFKKFSEMMKNRLVKKITYISSLGRDYFMDLKGCDVTAKYGDDGYFHAIVCDVSQHVVRVKWDTGEFTDYSRCLFESAVTNANVDVVASSSSVSSSVPTYMQQVRSELNRIQEICDRFDDINKQLDEMDYEFDYDSDVSVWLSDGPLSDDE